MLLKKLKQEKFDSNYQGVTSTTFLFEKEIEVIDFINSDYFKNGCTRDEIRDKPQQQQEMYLKPAFNLEELSGGDFRTLTQLELITFFDEYADGEWGETDREDFVAIWDNLKNKIAHLGESFTYHLISKEWFENQESRKNLENVDKRLKEPEFWIYGYYFLVIGISKVRKELVAFEMFYD